MSGTSNAVGLVILWVSALFLNFWIQAQDVCATDPDAMRISETGTTYYVRPDGGSERQCTGQVDAPYPGVGECQPCAWDHIFRALPPGGPPRIKGGDTLIIAPGSYKIGYGAPGTEACDTNWPWDCVMPPIPSGPAPERPTRILGAKVSSGGVNRPELWGTERAAFIFNLTGVTNVEIGWLELTDHHGCAEFHSGSYPCPRQAFPYGDWCPVAIYAEDSQNVYLHDLDIHGMAHTGIWAGRLRDWVLENVRIAGNGWAGWDGDVPGDDANTGALVFIRCVFEWNGCVETWPDRQPAGCWAQTAGGYGDGLGTGFTAGNWIFIDCTFRRNTSDGLDLFYAQLPGASVTLQRTLAAENAGNQIKTAGPTRLENCIVVGRCGFFEGQAFTHHVDPCRAFGNAVSFSLSSGERAELLHSTVTGEGDCLIELTCRKPSCDRTTSVFLRNNIFLGQREFLATNEYACLAYVEGIPADSVDADFSLIHGVKDDLCPVGPHDICSSPSLANMALASFDARLLSNSPAIDTGKALPTIGHDYFTVSRPLDGNNDGTNRPDIGAHEFVNPSSDSDGDGMLDYDEFVAGTDLTNAWSFLSIRSLELAPNLVLRWHSISGRCYDVFSAEDLNSPWESLATNIVATNWLATHTNAAQDGRRFYRLRVHVP